MRPGNHRGRDAARHRQGDASGRAQQHPFAPEAGASPCQTEAGFGSMGAPEARGAGKTGPPPGSLCPRGGRSLRTGGGSGSARQPVNPALERVGAGAWAERRLPAGAATAHLPPRGGAPQERGAKHWVGARAFGRSRRCAVERARSARALSPVLAPPRRFHGFPARTLHRAALCHPLPDRRAGERRGKGGGASGGLQCGRCEGNLVRTGRDS